MAWVLFKHLSITFGRGQTGWLILFLIPLVNIVIMILTWMGVAERMKTKPGWPHDHPVRKYLCSWLFSFRLRWFVIRKGLPSKFSTWYAPSPSETANGYWRGIFLVHPEYQGRIWVWRFP